VLESALTMQQLAIELALDADDLQLAAAWLASNERWLDWSGAVYRRSEHFTLLGSYHRKTGDRSAALAAATTALGHASVPRQPLALIAAHRLMGLLLTDAGDYERANDHLQASLALTETCVVPFERALTLLAKAELDIAQAAHEPARAALAEARAICEPLAARPTLERIATLEQQVRSAA
jgi:tetratricopeptide (TPR) repeat protein